MSQNTGVEMDKQLCTIPAAFVPLAYTNDPETEDLIFGDQLTENMVILLEKAMLRADPDSLAEAGAHKQLHIQETARWCRVVGIRQNRDALTLICEYSDGSRRSRSYNTSFAWFVKKASMPDLV